MPKMPKDDMAEESNTPSQDTEQTPSDSGDGDSGQSKAQVPEDFQNRVHQLIDECDNQKMLDYIQSCCSEAQSDMNKEDSDGKPSEYSTDGMPS